MLRPPPLTRLRLDDLDGLVAAELDREPAVADTCRAFVRGGKRLRARLLFASMDDCGPAAAADAVRGAAAIELVHAASLMHDDIVDRCTVRRELPALHRTIGERAATLSGSYLVQHVLTLIADLPFAVRSRMGEVSRQLSRGQLTEILRAFDTGMQPAERLAIMADKTAAIFGLACELGGALSERPAECSSRLRELGAAFGMVFQIADDVDDLFASQDDLGRPAGSDLDGGVITLPLVFALASDSRAEVVRVLDPATPADPSERLSRCRALVRGSGALRRTHGLALQYAERGAAHLDRLPCSEGTRWMDSILCATLARVTRYAEADAPDL
jgi:heptaprenyl diphosphate synthase